MSRRERRGSYRVDVSGATVQMDALPGLPAVEVLELSGGGGRLVSPDRRLSSARGLHAALQPAGHAPFMAHLDPVWADDWRGGLHVGFRFDAMSEEGFSALARFLVQRYQRLSARAPHFHWLGHLSLASRRRAGVRDLLLLHAARLRRPISVFEQERKLPVQLCAQLVWVEAARQLLQAEIVEGDAAELEPGRELTFAFAGPNSINHFTTRVWRRTPGSVHLLVPPDIRQVGFRSALRFRLHDRRPMHVTFEHPRHPGRWIHRQVVDVSAQGFSVVLDPARDALFPGQTLLGVVVPLARGEVRLDAVIRSVAPFEDDGRVACGLEIVRMGRTADVESWNRFVFDCGHEGTSLGGTDDVERAWRVLGSSGYLDLLGDEERRGLERRYRDVWARQLETGATGRLLLVCREGAAVGTAAASALYPRTWMPHHFGIDERRREDRSALFAAARSIYLGTMYVLQHFAECEHFVFYFDAAKRWHDLLFRRFLDRCTDRTAYVWDTFALYKKSAFRTPAPCVRPEHVVEGGAGNVGSLAAAFARTLPALERDAYALGEGEITLEAFTRECARKGYERGRRLLFCMEDHRPRAALVAETGDEGTNIFSLLNRCWMVPLDDGGLTEEGMIALLVEAERLYARLGKSAFLVSERSGDLPGAVVQEAGLSKVATGVRWLAHRRVIPAYINYIQEIMDQRSAQE